MTTGTQTLLVLAAVATLSVLFDAAVVTGEEDGEDDSGAEDDENDVRSPQWDFNGDGFVDATGNDVSHTYGSVFFRSRWTDR